MVDHLLEEVNADIRAERLENLWRNYRKPLIAAIVGVLLFTALSSIWQRYEEKRGGELMITLTDAKKYYDAGRFTEAAVGFETAVANARGEGKQLAQLWLGRARMASGQKELAIEAWKQAAAGKSLWADLACLRLSGLDEASAGCLAATHDSPLASQRRAWQAANDWKAGKTDKAIATLEELATSNNEPEASRAQLSQWIATLRASQPAATAQ